MGRPDEPYLGPCDHCPMPDTCNREGDCRASWDSRAGQLRNAAHRAQAERVPCPYCHAPAGQTCRNTTTGEPLDRMPAHPARLAATRPTTEATP
jgi:hypothetical protein